MNIIKGKSISNNEISLEDGQVLNIKNGCADNQEIEVGICPEHLNLVNELTLQYCYSTL